jgi:hypothetical protein
LFRPRFSSGRNPEFAGNAFDEVCAHRFKVDNRGVGQFNWFG